MSIDVSSTYADSTMTSLFMQPPKKMRMLSLCCRGDIKADTPSTSYPTNWCNSIWRFEWWTNLPHYLCFMIAATPGKTFIRHTLWWPRHRTISPHTRQQDIFSKSLLAHELCANCAVLFWYGHFDGRGHKFWFSDFQFVCTSVSFQFRNCVQSPFVATCVYICACMWYLLTFFVAVQNRTSQFHTLPHDKYWHASNVWGVIFTHWMSSVISWKLILFLNDSVLHCGVKAHV